MEFVYSIIYFIVQYQIRNCCLIMKKPIVTLSLIFNIGDEERTEQNRMGAKIMTTTNSVNLVLI